MTCSTYLRLLQFSCGAELSSCIYCASRQYTVVLLLQQHYLAWYGVTHLRIIPKKLLFDLVYLLSVVTRGCISKLKFKKKKIPTLNIWTLIIEWADDRTLTSLTFVVVIVKLLWFYMFIYLFFQFALVYLLSVLTKWNYYCVIETTFLFLFLWVGQYTGLKT